jgi:uncharacterized protein
MNYPTKYRTENNKRMKKISLLFLSFLVVATLFAIPEKPVPAKLVNDFAQAFDQQQVFQLENKLRDFSNSTSTQIIIVTVNSLDGDEASSYAQQIGEKWGVGTEGFNNGIVVLFKPKTSDSRGEAFIATGRGLEAVIPDAVCKRIVENEMIPKFKENDIYGGINAAVDVLMSLSLKEFTAQAYVKKTDAKKGRAGIFFLLIALFFIIQIFSASAKARRSSIGSKGLPLWLLLSMMGSGGSRSSGSFGNFSSGGSSFGGFGGGSFGGGGAGGSW